MSYFLTNTFFGENNVSVRFEAGMKENAIWKRPNLTKSDLCFLPFLRNIARCACSCHSEIRREGEGEGGRIEGHTHVDPTRPYQHRGANGGLQLCSNVIAVNAAFLGIEGGGEEKTVAPPSIRSPAPFSIPNVRDGVGCHTEKVQVPPPPPFLPRSPALQFDAAGEETPTTYRITHAAKRRRGRRNNGAAMLTVCLSRRRKGGRRANAKAGKDFVV